MFLFIRIPHPLIRSKLLRRHSELRKDSHTSRSLRAMRSARAQFLHNVRVMRSDSVFTKNQNASNFLSAFSLSNESQNLALAIIHEWQFASSSAALKGDRTSDRRTFSIAFRQYVWTTLGGVDL
jgi:hypothetical protein